MAENLAGGNTAIALLGNTIPTGAILVVLITILGPVSGAHFNPAVSLVMCMSRRMAWQQFIPYAVCQTLGGIIGVWLAHAMFDLSILEISSKLRWSTGQWIAEMVAAFGLVVTIFGSLRHSPSQVPMAVGLYITAAYWFTSSTSFANPAVTLARSLTDSFAGIAPVGVIPFIVAQFAGALAGLAVSSWLFEEEPSAAVKRP